MNLTGFCNRPATRKYKPGVSIPLSNVECRNAIDEDGVVDMRQRIQIATHKMFQNSQFILCYQGVNMKKVQTIKNAVSLGKISNIL